MYHKILLLGLLLGSVDPQTHVGGIFKEDHELNSKLIRFMTVTSTWDASNGRVLASDAEESESAPGRRLAHTTIWCRAVA